MIKRLSLLVSLALCGCGQIEKVPASDPRVHTGIDPRLQPYVTSFENEVGAVITDIPINIADYTYGSSGFTGDRIGVCATWENTSYREVIINPKYAALFNDTSQYYIELELLVWHELGHCFLNKKHNNKTLMADGTICDMKDNQYGCPDGQPLSIMRWFTMSAKEILLYYIPQKQKYIDDLKDVSP